ncbi:MAG: ADP-ribosylglycohydrolase family protein [Desulfobacterales bacterium]
MKGALFGMFIGDALAMPVHRYYDREAWCRITAGSPVILPLRTPTRIPSSGDLRTPRPTGPRTSFMTRPHIGAAGASIITSFKPGENTLNIKLAREWLIKAERDKPYSPTSWLEHPAAFMTTPGTHQDTYIEEYLRHFFTVWWQRHTATDCGRKDENHIGGLALYLPVLIVFSKDRDHARKTALQHLALTHGGPAMARGGALIADILLDVLYGRSLPDAILSRDVYNQQLASLLDFPTWWWWDAIFPRPATFGNPYPPPLPGTQICG